MLAGSFLADASTGQPSRAYERHTRLAFRSWRARIVRRGWLNGARSVAPFRLLDAFTRHAGKRQTSPLRGSRRRTVPCRSPLPQNPAGKVGREASPRPGRSNNYGVTEPTLLFAQGVGQGLAPSFTKASARFRPPGWPDSSAFRPLHSAALHFRRLQFRSTAFRRSQTAETGKGRRAPGAAMLRISARTSNSTARFHPVQDAAIAAGSVQLSFAALPKLPEPADGGPNASWSDTQPLGFAACSSRLKKGRRQSAGQQSATLQRLGVREMASRYRADARERVQTPRHRWPCASTGVGMEECFRENHTTHFVGDPPVIYSGRTGNPETLCWK